MTEEIWPSAEKRIQDLKDVLEGRAVFVIPKSPLGSPVRGKDEAVAPAKKAKRRQKSAERSEGRGEV